MSKLIKNLYIKRNVTRPLEQNSEYHYDLGSERDF